MFQVTCNICPRQVILKDQRAIKKAKASIYTCNPCSQRNRIRSDSITNIGIDWDETQRRFGHNQNTIPYRGRLIIKCSTCDKPLEITYRGPKAIKKQIGNATHLKCQKHSNGAKQKAIDASRKYWSDPLSKAIASEIIKGHWSDKGFRHKIITAMLSNDNHFINWTQEQRVKHSKDLWLTEEYRTKLLDIMQSQEHKQLKSDMCTTEQRETNRQLMIELWADENYRAKLANTAFWKPQPSKLQRRLIPIFNMFSIKWNEEYLIRYYHFDYFLPELNILIEVQGNYWHNQPTNIIRDEKKRKFVKDKTSYELVEIWEDEFKNNNKLINKIKSLL